MNQDLEHLRLLSIFHYVVGALTGLCACFPIFHLVMGILVLTGPEKMFPHDPDFPPRLLFGLMFTIIPAIVILAGWTVAVCTLIAGRFLSRQKHHTFCFVVAMLQCLFMPFGTVLGVFTIIVLVRPSVKALFESPTPY